jgi:hypothetical protein
MNRPMEFQPHRGVEQDVDSAEAAANEPSGPSSAVVMFPREPTHAVRADMVLRDSFITKSRRAASVGPLPRNLP